MADRFPSIEDIDEGKVEPTPQNDNLLDDGNDAGGDSSDFLSRERAALGADADQFSTPQDDAAAGGGDDLLGADGQTNGSAAAEEINQFQSSFPPVSAGNQAVGPGGSITTPTSTTLPYRPPEEEPEVIKSWRERRNLAIQAREEAAAARREETIKQAQTSIDEFYENYNNKKEKNIGQTRKEAEEFLAKREDTTAGGTSWERIGKLVDVRKGGGVGLGGGEGKEKFRELLVGLGKDEKAPGAKGY